MGYVQGGQVTLDDFAAKLPVYEGGDAAEETLAGVVAKAPVAGLGVKDAQVARRVVRFVPTVLPGRRYLKQARAFYLRCPAENVLGPGRTLVVVGMDDLWRFSLVDPLRLMEETIAHAAVDVFVPE